MPPQTPSDKKKSRSLTVTLAIAFVAMSLTIVLITTGLQGFSNYQNQQRTISYEQKLIAQGAADTVKNMVTDRMDKLRETAYLSSIATSPPEQQKATLDKLLHFDPAFRQVILFNATGEELARSSRVSRAESNQISEPIRADIFARAVQGKTFIGPAYIDEKSSEPMVVMAVPVTDIFGDYKGVLAAEVNLKFMWDLVGNLKIGEGGTAYVVDGQGNLIAYRDISRILKGENVLGLEDVRRFVSGRDTVYDAEVTQGMEGDAVIANYVSLGEPDWAVVVEMPVDEVYREFNKGLYRTIIILLASLVLASIAGILLSRFITKPLILLRDATREISKGNLDTRVEISSMNEIGELADSFNRMTADLVQTTVSRDYFDDILKSMFDMLIVLEPDATIQSVNRRTCDVLGYRSDELVGRSFSHLLSPDSPRPDGAATGMLPGTRAVTEIERIFMTKGGRKIPIILSSSVMHDSTGAVRAIVCVAHDMTERKKVEEELRESRQLFMDIISFLPDPTYVIDKTGTVLAWNRALEVMSGVPAEEIIGIGNYEYSLWAYGRRRPLLIDLVLDPDKDSARLDYSDIHWVGRTVTAQTVITKADGRKIPISLVTSPLIDSQGNTVGAIESLRDITSVKKAEADLARLNAGLEKIVKERTKALEEEVEVRKQAEAAIRLSLDEKVLLLREVHHRVNNNLQIIISLTKLQLRTLEDPGMKQALSDMQSRVRAMAIVHEKLYQTEDLSSIDIADYTQYLVTQIFGHYKVDRQKVALNIDIGKILLNIDTAIPLGLILNELVGNAIKYAFPDGRKGELTIRMTEEGEILTVVVQDNGIGISSDIDWQNTPSLGLRLVGNLVDQLFGTIELDRSSGTKFTMVLHEKK
ncbi:PAS domain S-box protein [Methanoregula sp.]|uniref:PAS domain S-box protein n=1 Tax=Methanoregula sp. TaxID=2052170 RepID=UPI00260183DA|nr:PAS domain S-box protein [Methanoregula sp.]MDD5142034.1 PAS domain S-box protein [Methanoregula sp.]